MYENVIGLILNASRVHFNVRTPPKAAHKRFDTKKRTNDDRIRTSLLLLQEPGDAVAYELWYDRDCLRKVEHQCDFIRLHCTSVKDDVGTCMSNIDIINAVKCSLSTGTVLNMNYINDEYMIML